MFFIALGILCFLAIAFVAFLAWILSASLPVWDQEDDE